MEMHVFSPEIVSVKSASTSKEEVLDELGSLLFASGRISDTEAYLDAVRAREEHFPTGLEGGIAIPHAQSELVIHPSVAVATSELGIDFGADEGPATLIFMIAAPVGGENVHLEILAALARKLMHDDFRHSLASLGTSELIAEFLRKEVKV